MKTRLAVRKPLRFLLAASALGLGLASLAGCQNGSSISKQEEAQFKQGVRREIPPEAQQRIAEKMRASQERMHQQTQTQ